METLSKRITDYINSTGATVSVVVKEVNGSTLVAVNPSAVYHAASTIKVPILYTALALWDRGLLDLGEKIALTDAEKVGGCGVLKLMSSGTALPILDLLALMICVSDNTATNMMIERIGIDIVNAEMSSLGLKHTHLARKLMISCPTTYSKTSAADLVILFSNFTSDGPLSQEALKIGCDILINQQLNSKLNRDWHLCGQCGELLETDNNCRNCGTWAGKKSPIPLPFYHKTGEIVGVEHDAGILTIGDKSYAIAALSNGHDDNYEGRDMLSAIGNMILQELL